MRKVNLFLLPPYSDPLYDLHELLRKECLYSEYKRSFQRLYDHADLRSLGPLNEIQAKLLDLRALESLLALIKRLHSLTIRRENLYYLLSRLAVRKGTAFPLAITGGSVRDALQKKEGVDIDIVVGDTYDEVCNHLRDYFIAHGESVTENSLFTKRSAKKFGQLKVMNIVVRMIVRVAVYQERRYTECETNHCVLFAHNIFRVKSKNRWTLHYSRPTS